MVEATGQVDYINTSIGVATATLYMIEASMQVPPGYALFIPSAIRAGGGRAGGGRGPVQGPPPGRPGPAEGGCATWSAWSGARSPTPTSPPRPAPGDATDIRTCLSCNQECVGPDGPQPVARAASRTRGRAASRRPVPAPRRRRSVVVVGGGPGGLQAAVTAAERGHRVILFERHDRLGGQVQVAASVPSRAEFLDLARNLDGRRPARWAWTCAPGPRPTPAPVEAERPDAVVVATGARPARPWWAGDHARVVDVRDVLEGRAAPAGPVVVVDELGFHQATSTAELLADRGCAVEIVTNGMVVGQDLGHHPGPGDLEREGPRPGHRPEHRPGPDGGGRRPDGGGVVLGAAAPPDRHRPERPCDWVVCARPPAARGRAVAGPARRAVPGRTGSATAWPPGGPMPRWSRATGWRWRCEPAPTAPRHRRSRPRPGRPAAAGDGRGRGGGPGGRLPAGADEAVAEAGGRAVVVGSGAEEAAGALRRRAAGAGGPRPARAFRPGALAAALAPVLAGVPLVRAAGLARRTGPRPPTGRRAGPAAGGPGRAVARCGPDAAPARRRATGVVAELARLDDRVLVPGRASTARPWPPWCPAAARWHRRPRRPAVDRSAAGVTGAGGRRRVTADRRSTAECSSPTRPPWTWPTPPGCIGGGAGLVAGLRRPAARHLRPAGRGWPAALGASAGATRVATDAGWTGYERQIGTTGVAVDPDLYVALGRVGGQPSTSGGLGRPARGERQPRPVLPDDGHGRPRPGHRRPGPARGAGPPASGVATADRPGGTAGRWTGCPMSRRGGRAPGGSRPFDAVVVGAGPAGSAAALALARAGRSVVLVERGPFPGSKNVYGGVVYGRVLDAIIPQWWEEVPVERWVVRRSTMMMTGTQSLSVDYRTRGLGCGPLQRDDHLPLALRRRGWPTRPPAPGPSW